MQADQIHLIAIKVQRKYWTEPHKDTQRWTSRHDELQQSSQGLPKQELPATMLSMDFKRVWITDRSVGSPQLSIQCKQKQDWLSEQAVFHITCVCTHVYISAVQ